MQIHSHTQVHHTRLAACMIMYEDQHAEPGLGLCRNHTTARRGESSLSPSLSLRLPSPSRCSVPVPVPASGSGSDLYRRSRCLPGPVRKCVRALVCVCALRQFIAANVQAKPTAQLANWLAASVPYHLSI